VKIQDFFQENQQNIASLLDEEELNKILIKVTQKLSIDQQSRDSKIKKLQEYIKLALLIVDEKSYPFEGAANAMIPLVTNAVLNFACTAYPPLVQDDQIVKFKVIGNDDGIDWIGADNKPVIDEITKQPKKQNAGAKAAKGKRMATMMNYQVNEEMPWYKTDLFQYLIVLGTIGTIYKKVFYNSVDDAIIAKFMMPDKLIINENVSSLKNAVITEILDLSSTEVMENIRNGIFIDYDFDWEKESTQIDSVELINPEKENELQKQDFRFINQYTYLDLDNDGFPEPYIITVDLQISKIVRIIPDYDEENIQYVNNKVSKIERNETFIDYILIPSADGGHLGLGFGHLLCNLSNITNSTVNQMLDAGHLANKGGGLIGKSLNVRGGRFSMSLGEWKMVDSFGGNIRDSIVPLPVPEVSPTLFSLLGLLIDSAKETGSLRDVLTGDTAANMAPTTFMGLLDQGLKQFLAFFKNFHDSEKRSFKLIRKLNSKYLTDEKYAKVLDEKSLDVSAKDDFSDKNCDLVPVADPASVTSSQKMAQAQILQSLMQDPYYDPIKIRKMWNNAVQIPGLDDAIITPQPQPDANLIFAQAEDKKANVKMGDLQLRAMAMDEESIAGKIKNEENLVNIKVKESQVLKNISDAIIAEKSHNLKVLTSISDAMTAKIQTDITTDPSAMPQQESQQELPQELPPQPEPIPQA